MEIDYEIAITILFSLCAMIEGLQPQVTSSKNFPPNILFGNEKEHSPAPYPGIIQTYANTATLPRSTHTRNTVSNSRPMFAGKTTHLMQYAEEAFDQGQRVMIIRRDKRGGTKQNGVATHDCRHVQRTI